MMPANRQFLFDCCSASANLACAFRIDFPKISTSIRSFVFDFMEERTPTRIKNLFCQKASGKPFDIQIFYGNCAVIINNLCRKFMLEIVATIFNFLVNFTKMHNCFTPSMATFLSSGNFSLDNAHKCLQSFKESRVWCWFSFRISRIVFQTNINPNRFIGMRQSDRLIFNCEDSKPTRNFTFNCAGFDFAENFTAQANPHTSNFGKSEFIAVKFETALNVSERIKKALSLESGIARFFIASEAAKISVKCFRNTAQNVLQNLGIYFFNLRTYFFNFWQLRTLDVVVNRDTIKFPSIAAFLNGRVIKFSTKVQCLLEFVFERLRRFYFEFVTFQYLYFIQRFALLPATKNTQSNRLIRHQSQTNWKRVCPNFFKKELQNL